MRKSESISKTRCGKEVVCLEAEAGVLIVELSLD